MFADEPKSMGLYIMNSNLKPVEILVSHSHGGQLVNETSMHTVQYSTGPQNDCLMCGVFWCWCLCGLASVLPAFTVSFMLQTMSQLYFLVVYECGACQQCHYIRFHSKYWNKCTLNNPPTIHQPTTPMVPPLPLLPAWESRLGTLALSGVRSQSQGTVCITLSPSRPKNILPTFYRKM